jgi:hypothetical protein
MAPGGTPAVDQFGEAQRLVRKTRPDRRMYADGRGFRPGELMRGLIVKYTKYDYGFIKPDGSKAGTSAPPMPSAERMGRSPSN